jgi:hypothetical protein
MPVSTSGDPVLEERFQLDRVVGDAGLGADPQVVRDDARVRVRRDGHGVDGVRNELRRADRRHRRRRGERSRWFACRDRSRVAIASGDGDGGADVAPGTALHAVSTSTAGASTRNLTDRPIEALS